MFKFVAHNAERVHVGCITDTYTTRLTVTDSFTHIPQHAVVFSPNIHDYKQNLTHFFLRPVCSSRLVITKKQAHKKEKARKQST